MNYSERLQLLHHLSLVETGAVRDANAFPDVDALEAASYLACLISRQAIRYLEHAPDQDDLDRLSVYQAFAMLVYVYLALPLQEEGIGPDLEQGAVIIARSLFAGLSAEQLAECLESGERKFQLIGNAEHEHWMNFRQDLDKAAIAYVIAGTDDDAPFAREELLPFFSTMLNQLCEAFAG